MRYIRPDFYERFACIADKCPDTCCAGWQIMIDEDSLEKYENTEGEFGKILENSIDWEEGCFYQNNKRCAFLNDKNLCDLYLALGEEGFCDTCRNYPRHVEEFEGLRELSLSLSCPVAAKMILSNLGMPKFSVTEDEEPDELEDEFEDFDLLLFTQLEDARKAVFEKLAQGNESEQGNAMSGEKSMHVKMQNALKLAEKMQDCIEDDRFFDLEEVIREYSESENGEAAHTEPESSKAAVGTEDTCSSEKKEQYTAFYEQKLDFFNTVHGLERLRDEWSEVLIDLEATLYHRGEAEYHKLRERFFTYLEENQKEKERWENTGLQLFVFFVYTYFCGAVYDGWIFSKMALAVFSVEFIRELLMARWTQNGSLSFQDYVELSYRYAREIEHSDLNLNALEEYFMEKKQ